MSLSPGLIAAVALIYMAILFAIAFYGGADIWLFVSLAVLMGALYLNNTGSAARPTSA